jgi:hypothetical protein
MDRYSPFGDAVDLAVFERTCTQQRWHVDQIVLGSSSSSSDLSSSSSGDPTTGTDIIHLCVVECINKIRRRSSIPRTSSTVNAMDILKKLPADYACQVLTIF